MPTPVEKDKRKATTPKADESSKLSKETMKMKFMKRAADKISSPEATTEFESPLASANSNKSTQKESESSSSSSSQVVKQEIKWKLHIKLPKPKLSDDRIICLPITPDLKLHTLSKRSFGGFNPVVERANSEIVSSSESHSSINKKKRTTEKKDQNKDDDAKMKAYFNRGSAPPKNKMKAPHSTGKNKDAGHKNKPKKGRKSI